MSHSVICDDQFLSNAGEHLAAQSTAVTMRMALPIVVVMTMRQKSLMVSLI
jgi:hypothetical protein